MNVYQYNHHPPTWVVICQILGGGHTLYEARYYSTNSLETKPDSKIVISETIRGEMTGPYHPVPQPPNQMSLTRDVNPMSNNSSPHFVSTRAQQIRGHEWSKLNRNIRHPSHFVPTRVQRFHKYERSGLNRNIQQPR